MISPQEASLERLEAEAVLLVRYPPLSSVEADAMLTELVSSWGHGHDHKGPGELVWDVRPANGAARSQGLDEFTLHTDASFEDPPPRYVALFVVRADSQGGGRSEWVQSTQVLGGLSPAARDALAEEFRIRVPAEFYKGKHELVAPLVWGDSVRYRRELVVEPDELRLRIALHELDRALQGRRESRLLPAGTLLLMDNWRVFHGRTAVLDSARHLKRVRFFGPTGKGLH